MKYEYNLTEPPFTVEHLNIVNVVRNQRYTFNYRFRPRHGFIYTLSGEMTYRFRGKTIIAKTGELVFIPKETPYTAIYSGEKNEIKLVQFDISNGCLPDYLAQPRKIEFPNSSEQIEAFFMPLKTHSHGHPFYYLSRLYGFLQQLDEGYLGMPAKYKKLQGALRELSEHYIKNEKIDYYAELCGMSEAGFRRLFREYTGRSPVDYRNDLRLNYAQNLLRSGEYNVSEAAEASGFTNLSFFTRLYKRKYNHTPKQE